MVAAHITGNPAPTYVRDAHSATMAQLIHMIPDMHVNSDPYPVQFGTDDWITVVTNVTGTFASEMILPDSKVIPPTGKTFDVEFGQTTKRVDSQLIPDLRLWASSHGQRGAAIDTNRLAGNLPCRRFGQEEDSPGDVRGLPESKNW
jgi:hypothetical protein